MAGDMRIIGSTGRRGEGAFADGIARAASGTRDEQRRRRPSARDRGQSDDAAPDGALAETRARIATALTDVGQLQTMLEAAMDRAPGDSDAIAAAQALAGRISANRPDAIAAQARIEAETVKIVIER